MICRLSLAGLGTGGQKTLDVPAVEQGVGVAAVDELERVAVHLVDEVYDHGAIIAQWPVPVSPNDSIASLAARVLAVEHLLYPRVVHAICNGRIRLGDDGRVTGVPPLESAAAFSMGDYVRLRQSLDQWLGT